MKFQMAKNSLFAVLLRSPWWISLLVALLVGLVGFALLPQQFKVVGALSGLPFAIISAIAAVRQRHQPSAARVQAIEQALAAMAWPQFAGLLEQTFQRDGHTVQRAPGSATGYDFDLDRKGRRMLVSAKRWKSARTGVDVLRNLHTARVAAEAQEGATTTDALFIGLGPLSEGAKTYAVQHRIAIWQAAELAEALRGLSLNK